MPANTTQETLLSLDHLSFAAVASVPVSFDWGQEGEWETIFLPGAACPDCETVYPDGEPGDGCRNCLIDNGGYSYLDARGDDPIMNYYYPLPAFNSEPEQAQEKLAGLCLTLVHMTNCEHEADGEGYALALTGGGMDLSWDICEAYLRLGYAPPLHFAHLPNFAGQNNGKEPFWSVLKALLLSIESEERGLAWTKSQIAGTIKAAIACPDCGHAIRHNRVGGCEKVVNWKMSGEHDRCSCLGYPDRPDDSERVWDTVCLWER